MLSTLLSGDSRLLLMPYDAQWRQVRKIMHQVLNARQLDVFMPFQDLESKQLCWDYLNHKEQWYHANARYANSVIMSVVFGRRTSLDDPDCRELFETVDTFLENFKPGYNPVDTYTFLARLPKPLQWWRPRGEREFQKTKK